MKLCACCRSIVLYNVRPDSFVECEFVGQAVFLHRFCISDWLLNQRRLA